MNYSTILTAKPAGFFVGPSQTSFATPSGVATWHYAQTNAGQFGFDTFLSDSTYRFHFSSDDLQTEAIKRALGCILIALLPSAGIDSVLSTLRETYEFYAEDEQIVQQAPFETLRSGVAVGELGSTEVPGYVDAEEADFVEWR